MECNVFEAVQKTRSTCFIGSKNTAARLLNITSAKTGADAAAPVTYNVISSLP